jgi:hypothetical protein
MLSLSKHGMLLLFVLWPLQAAADTPGRAQTTQWLAAHLPTSAVVADAFSSMSQKVTYAADGCRIGIDDTSYVKDFSAKDDAFSGLVRVVVRVRPAAAGAIRAIAHDLAHRDVPQGFNFGARTRVTLFVGLLDGARVTVERQRSIDAADGTVHAGIDGAWMAFPFDKADAALADQVAQAFRRAIRLCSE